MANILVRLKNAAIKFAKAPATTAEKWLTAISPIAQGLAAFGILPTAPALSVPLLLSAVFTWLDKDSKRKDLFAKVLRVLSIAGQGITAVLSWPIVFPAAVLSALTAVHTFIDNLGDFLDDGKINKSFKTKK